MVCVIHYYYFNTVAFITPLQIWLFIALMTTTIIVNKQQSLNKDEEVCKGWNAFITFARPTECVQQLIPLSKNVFLCCIELYQMTNIKKS